MGDNLHKNVSKLPPEMLADLELMNYALNFASFSVRFYDIVVKHNQL